MIIKHVILSINFSKQKLICISYCPLKRSLKCLYLHSFPKTLIDVKVEHDLEGEISFKFY